MWVSRFSFFTLWVLHILSVVIFVVLLKRMYSEIYLIELPWELHEKESQGFEAAQITDRLEKQLWRKHTMGWLAAVTKTGSSSGTDMNHRQKQGKNHVQSTLSCAEERKRPHMHLCPWRGELWKDTRGSGHRGRRTGFSLGFTCTCHFKPRDHITHSKVRIWGAFAILLSSICQFGLNILIIFFF